MADSKQKIRIRLKAYDHEIIDQSTKKIVETVRPHPGHGPGPDAAAHREAPLHGDPLAAQGQGLAASTSRCASTSACSTSSSPSPKTVDSLQRLDLPAGVDIEIKIQQA